MRKIDRFDERRDGEPLLVLRDPLAISEAFALDAEFGPVLDLLDGKHTVAQVRQSLLLGGTLDVSRADLESFVASLSEGGWLDDDAFRARWEALHGAFIDSPARAFRHAGSIYPAGPEALRAQLDSLLGPAAPRLTATSGVCGLVAPHGPLPLTASVLGPTLQELPRANDVDLIVVLGTDHSPGLLPFVGTDKRFETPLGPVSVDPAMFDALERRVPWIRREEIRHRDAHTLELAAVLLRYLYGDGCPPILPLLCGQTSLQRKEAERAELFVASLESLLEDRRTLLWGSAELSHAGPAYGRPPIEGLAPTSAQDRDLGCLNALTAGRYAELAQRCVAPHPQGRPSGGAVLATLAQLLPANYRAEIAGHETKKIPGKDDGWVGLAGLRFYDPPPQG